jgi:hypothetical protein
MAARQGKAAASSDAGVAQPIDTATAVKRIRTLARQACRCRATRCAPDLVRRYKTLYTSLDAATRVKPPTARQSKRIEAAAKKLTQCLVRAGVSPRDLTSVFRKNAFRDRPEPFTKLSALADTICACKTRRCATNGVKRLTALNARVGDHASPQLRARMAATKKRLRTCLSKNGAGSPALQQALR